MRTKVISFPQADNVNVLLNLILVIDEKKGITPIEVSSYYEMTERQYSYYLNALLFLSLLDAHGNRFFINDKSKVIRESKDPKVALAQYILMYHPFDTLRVSISNLSDTSKQQEQVATYLLDNYQLSSSTAKRRAGTVLSWIKWAEENK